MSGIRASIIIPTYNSESTLEDCLQSIICNETYYKYEVIVCDAGSTDNTINIAKRYANKVLIGGHHKINRNIGLAEAQGEFVLFTDSDCVVPENWIDGLIDGLCSVCKVNTRVVGIGGSNIPLLKNDSTKLERAIAKVMRSPLVAFKARNTAFYKENKMINHNPPINSAYFKWILNDIGGFVERKGYPEDLDLDTRIIENGYLLYYLPNITVWHKHKSSYESFANQMRDFGYKRITVNKKHPSLVRIYHYAPLELFYSHFTPLIVIPLLLAFVNTIICGINIRVFRLTLSFYWNYGMGEYNALTGRKNENIFN